MGEHMITVTPPNVKRHGSKWTIKVEGRPPEKADPNDGAQLRRACKHLGVAPADVLVAIDEAAEEPEPEVVSEIPTMIRAWTGTEEAKDFSTFVEALDSGSAFISATGPGWSMVDVDLTDAAKESHRGWTIDDVDRITRRAAAPTPAFAWPTRSGGYRAIFTSLSDAGLWCLLVSEVTCAATVKITERITVTHAPVDEFVGSDQTCGVGDLRAALLHSRDAEAAHPDAVEAWLAENRMERGIRYPHDHCPFDANHVSQGNPSVEAYDHGVHCYSCHRTAPWSALVSGGAEPDPIPAVRMAQEFIHWEHAKRVLEAEYPQVEEVFRKAGYGALLGVLHAEPNARTQKRIKGIWDRDRAYMRAEGQWIRSGDYQLHRELSQSSLLALPWTGGKPDRKDLALGSAELRGYYPIEPVLHLVDRPTWHGKTVWVPRPVRTAEASGVLTRAQADEHLQEALNGVTESWLSQAFLLTVGALRAQLRLPQPVYVLIEGDSGHGKGALVALAAGIMGTEVGKLRFDGADELAMSVGKGLQSGASILFGDEAGKAERWWHQSSTLLEMSSTHTWRQLYVGDTATPVRAALVIGGSSLPRGLASMAEFSRRSSYLRVYGGEKATTKLWGGGVKGYLRVGRLEDLRQSSIGAAIAEAYVREAREVVMDTAGLEWPTVADRLGGRRLSETDDAVELTGIVQGLYAIWKSNVEETRISKGRKSGWLRCWPEGRGADGAAELMAEWLDEDASLRERRARIAALCTGEPEPGVTVRGHVRSKRVYVKFVGRGK